MKKIFFIFFLLPLFIDAQDTTLHKSVGVSFSNDWCYRLTKASGDASDLKSEFDSLESAHYGYTAGFFGSYAFNPSIDILAGINFASRGYAIDTLEEAGLVDMRFKYRYLEIPLRLRYTFGNEKKVQPIASLGLFGGYLFQNKATYSQVGLAERGSYSNDESLSKMNVGISASFGIQKRILANYIFVVEVIGRQSLTPLNDAPLKRYLNSAGINLSLAKMF